MMPEATRPSVSMTARVAASLLHWSFTDSFLALSIWTISLGPITTRATGPKFWTISAAPAGVLPKERAANEPAATNLLVSKGISISASKSLWPEGLGYVVDTQILNIRGLLCRGRRSDVIQLDP